MVAVKLYTPKGSYYSSRYKAILRYHEMGLNHSEINRLTGASRTTIIKLLKDLEASNK